METKTKNEMIIEKGEVSEIDFIKELLIAITVSALILFLTLIVIIGTFFENNFCRQILTWFTENSNSTESDIQNGGFAISIAIVVLILVISHLGSNTKSEILKKT